jgi:hypothetical protein
MSVVGLGEGTLASPGGTLRCFSEVSPCLARDSQRSRDILIAEHIDGTEEVLVDQRMRKKTEEGFHSTQ